MEYFPGFTTLQLCNKVQEFLFGLSEKQEEFTGRITFMSMFNDISWGSEHKGTGMRIKRQSMREDFHLEDGHSSDLDQKRSGTISAKIITVLTRYRPIVLELI